MTLEKKRSRVRALIVLVGGVALVGGALATVTSIASADTATTPTGTALCVSNGVGLVLTPSASGRCLLGQTPVTVANLGGVAGLGTQLSSLQSLMSAHFAGGIGGVGATGSAGGTTSSYTVPQNVHQVRVELWGGGGGGGGGANDAHSAGGSGAQGDYLHAVVNVVPGDVCTVVVGNGGKGTQPASNLARVTAQSGGDSTFSCTQSPASLDAPGGAGAQAGNAAGHDAKPGAPSAAFQLYPGQDGGFGPESVFTNPNPQLGPPGGGVGFPGAGGVGGNSTSGAISPPPATGGQPAAAGLAVVTPVG